MKAICQLAIAMICVGAMKVSPNNTLDSSLLQAKQDLMQSTFAGINAIGQKYYQVPKPLIDVRYLSDQDDKLMNRLILDGYALVLESDPMVSGDDSHCGCNCGCCFNMQAVGKSQDQCTKECGCDCECCSENKSKQTQYWMDKKGTEKVARELVTEWLKKTGKDLDTFMMIKFDELWDHFDVNKTGLVEIERMSQFYKMLLGDMTLDLQ